MQSNNTLQSEMNSTRVFFKIHRKNKTEILALCDESILGQELFSDKARMRIPVDFYRGQEISAPDALRLMRNYANINALGSVIELGIKQKVIPPDAIIWFTTAEGKKIPHLLIFALPPL
ncbi:MAG: DUF424 family protein [Candidatus Heimdallarchaeota archaeon]|nr:MAG: DUF424 family protein [Candidatus Heimdallarchaeota archaeon]